MAKVRRGESLDLHHKRPNAKRDDIYLCSTFGQHTVILDPSRKSFKSKVSRRVRENEARESKLGSNRWSVPEF